MSSANPREGLRVPSIARGIAWGYWWRRLLSWLVFDIVLIALALALVLHANRAKIAPLDATVIPIGIRGEGLDPDTIRFYFLVDDVERSIPLGATVRQAMPFAAVIGAWELFDLLSLAMSTRRVRRRLQPLNELALTAEEIGARPLMDAAQIETLEQAIERASVDSPTVTTGDRDLQSIEVALNGLLRRMQEAKLQQMRFVSDASHELRTPIAVIQGYVNMLDRWGKTDEKVLDESIEALKLESDHMQELVEQLLFLARGDSGRNSLRLASVDVGEMLHEVCEEYQMIDESHEYLCSVPDGSSANLVAQVDLAMLKQSLRIMVENARKYSPAGTQISLSAAADDASVTFSVQDEGIGLSPADAAHIFDRFYRSDSARQKDVEGSGLGLSIAKWIVDAHGGTIEVLSSEGVGTRFTVRIPRA